MWCQYFKHDVITDNRSSTELLLATLARAAGCWWGLLDLHHQPCGLERGFTSMAWQFFPPVSAPHSAWWPGPVLLCSRCPDTGFAQRPPPAVPAVCWWRWCGGVSWRGRGKASSACPRRPPQGAHTRSPSSAVPLRLFSAGGEAVWSAADSSSRFLILLNTTQPKMSGDS